MYWLYNTLLILTMPIWFVWMMWRSRKRAEAPNWRERQGSYPFVFAKGRPRIWIHAVSVGEVVASIPVVERLRELRPDAQLLLTVTTSSGHQTARDRLLTPGLVDRVAYFPIDVALFQFAALSTVRPHVVAVMETELWFNFLWASKQVSAFTCLINGRISERSFGRGQKLAFFYRALFKNLDVAYMQSEADATRIRSLGAERVEVVGNTKFDEASAAASSDRSHWRSLLGIAEDELLVVVGSTRGEEEAGFVARALQAVTTESKWRIVHAPRHLELADYVETCYQGPVARRSRGDHAQVMILDTYGELGAVYAAADIAIVGGGFEKHGGQNLIQPLAAGIPVLHGPYMTNFRSVADQAVEAGASKVCRTEQELTEAVTQLLNDAGARSTIGAIAEALVQTNLGASETYAKKILAALPEKL